MILNADSLARLQALVNTTLEDTCRIEREVTSQGLAGEPTHVRELVADDVPCRLIEAGIDTSTGAMTVGERETLEEINRLVVQAGTVLDSDYLVMLKGAEYLVTRVKQGLSSEVMVQALVIRKG